MSKKPIGGCTKRPFDTPEQAKRQLRVWQRRGRRAELDTAHTYLADCVEHRGKFHVGRKHDPTQRGRPLGSSNVHNAHNMARMRERIADEIDDVFDAQVQRIVGKFARTEKVRRQRFVRGDEGALIMAESGTLAPGGDELDVYDK